MWTGDPTVTLYHIYNGWHLELTCHVFEVLLQYLFLAFYPVLIDPREAVLMEVRSARYMYVICLLSHI